MKTYTLARSYNDDETINDALMVGIMRDECGEHAYYLADEVDEEIKRIKAEAEKWENVEAKAYEDKIAELVEMLEMVENNAVRQQSYGSTRKDISAWWTSAFSDEGMMNLRALIKKYKQT